LINIPEGTDITPYAIKNADGKKPAKNKLKSKLTFISSRIEFKIFVINDITKKIKNINDTIK